MNANQNKKSRVSNLLVLLLLFSGHSVASICENLTSGAVLIIEENQTCELPSGTKLIFLQKLVMKDGARLVVNTNVDSVQLKLGELIAEPNTVIDASARLPGKNGENGSNAAGQPGYGRRGYGGDHGENGLKGQPALVSLEITAGIRKVEGLTVRSNGSAGGNGGNGGNGGIGGGYKCKFGNSQQPGPGGSGGNAGSGGNGGEPGHIAFYWKPISPLESNDTDFPGAIILIANGGKGGVPGKPGNGGPSHHGYECGTFQGSVNPSAPGGAGSKGSRGKNTEAVATRIIRVK